MKDVRVRLENGGFDEGGDFYFIAYAELFPIQTRTKQYSSIAETKALFQQSTSNFIFEHLNEFPDYQWADYEVVPPYDEHRDMYEITYIEAPDLKDDFC